MYEQTGGSWITLENAVIKEGVALLRVNSQGFRDRIYNEMRRRLVQNKGLPDTVTVDRYPDGDIMTRSGEQKFAYIIGCNRFRSNKEAKRLLSKEW